MKPSPREKRRNRELRFIEKVMRQAWAEFRAAQNHSEKRGRAMVLQAHIEEWLDQPEFITDLEEGVSPPRGPSCQPDDVPGDAEFPFDRGGEATDVFCYATDSFMSRLFTKAEVDADPNRYFRYGCYVVALYEKLYATEGETRMHFSSDAAMARHLSSSTAKRFSKRGDFNVLADPKGCPYGEGNKIVYRARTFAKARARADEYAEAYGIRFVVARVEALVDTH